MSSTLTPLRQLPEVDAFIQCASGDGGIEPFLMLFAPLPGSHFAETSVGFTLPAELRLWPAQ